MSIISRRRGTASPWILLQICLAAAVVVGLAGQAKAQDAPKLTYTVAVEKPGDRDFDVTIRVEGVSASSVDLAMPIWLPGVYEIQNYAGAVRQFTAVDSAGKSLDVTLPSKNVWRVASGGAPFTVRYQLDVSGKQKLYSKSQIDDAVGVIQAGAGFLFLPAHRRAGVSLKLELPEAWRVATALAGGPREFTAVDYDEFVDSPVLFGDFTRLDFKIRGIPFAVVVDKRLKFDLMTLGKINARLAEAQMNMFGGAPFPKYLFLYMVTDDPSGRSDGGIFLGLEHDESTLITIDPRLASSETLSGRWLAEVSSHELFHAWNVRFIKPDSLVTPDYLTEPKVQSLWLLEGATSYYAKRFVSATLLDAPTGQEWLFDEMAQSLASLESRESLVSLSLEAATGGIGSFRKLYPRGEATALLLDLQMRAESDGRVGFDDVMRRLYEKSREKPGFNEDMLPAIFSEVAGRDYADFFRRYVTGREKPPIEDYLRHAGWKVGMRSVGGAGFTKTLREDEAPTALQQRIRASILVRERAAAATASPK